METYIFILHAEDDQTIPSHLAKYLFRFLNIRAIRLGDIEHMSPMCIALSESILSIMTLNYSGLVMIEGNTMFT